MDVVFKKEYPKSLFWKKNFSQRLREMGLSYVNSKGEHRPARQMRPGCNAGCIHNCLSNFNEAERIKIHKHFWTLKRREKQDFYDRFIERHLPKRKRIKHESRRVFTYIYRFPLNDNRLQVCQDFFVKTLGIGIGCIRHFFAKQSQKS